MSVALETDARDIDRDDDVRVGVAVGAVAQGDLVLRIRPGRVGTGRRDTEHNEHGAERDRRRTERAGAKRRTTRGSGLVVVRVVIRVAPYFALQCLQRPQLASTTPQRRPLHAVARDGVWARSVSSVKDVGRRPRAEDELRRSLGSTTCGRAPCAPHEAASAVRPIGAGGRRRDHHGCSAEPRLRAPDCLRRWRSSSRPRTSDGPPDAMRGASSHRVLTSSSLPRAAGLREEAEAQVERGLDGARTRRHSRENSWIGRYTRRGRRACGVSSGVVLEKAQRAVDGRRRHACDGSRSGPR
ncbi:MAG: hypothetical protein QOC79_2348 [Actinomycetota bacterium]|nr:hypothetical protein [Actinomycetota bacterium]